MIVKTFRFVYSFIKFASISILLAASIPNLLTIFNFVDQESRVTDTVFIQHIDQEAIRNIIDLGDKCKRIVMPYDTRYINILATRTLLDYIKSKNIEILIQSNDKGELYSTIESFINAEINSKEKKIKRIEETIKKRKKRIEENQYNINEDQRLKLENSIKRLNNEISCLKKDIDITKEINDMLLHQLKVNHIKTEDVINMHPNTTYSITMLINKIKSRLFNLGIPIIRVNNISRVIGSRNIPVSIVYISDDTGYDSFPDRLNTLIKTGKNFIFYSYDKDICNKYGLLNNFADALEKARKIYGSKADILLR